MAGTGLAAEDRGGVLILTLSQAPSNALKPGLRTALLDAIAGRPVDCRAIVLAAAGPNFSSHLPLELTDGAPPLARLCSSLAEAGVPVVAALQGLAMGPGAELALAATARIGTPDSRLAFPEVALGLCSAAGSTARLPRLIGADAALQLLLSGRVVRSDEALRLGLLDELSEASLIPDAIALAERLAAGEGPERRVETAQSWQAAIASARRATVGSLPAPHRIIDCVEAALLLPAENVAAFEAVARADLEASPEASGLCAAARADRRAAELPPAIARAPAVPLTMLGLVGEAPALATLARAALARGIPLRWMLATPQGLAARLGLSEAEAQLLQPVDDPSELSPLALQVHASRPDPAARWPQAAGTALLVLEGSEPDLGLSLAPSGRFCEVAFSAEESAQSIASALAGLRRLGLSPLLVGRRPGLGRRVLRAGEVALARLAASGVPQRQLSAALSPYSQRLPDTPTGPTLPRDLPVAEIRNRWLGAMAAEAMRLLDQGVARRSCDVDHALVAGFGFPRWLCGPMHQADQRGLLVLRSDLRAWAAEDTIWQPPPLLDRLIKDGLRLGALDAAP